MGCGSSSEVRAITPESSQPYNNNNKQQHQQRHQQQHQQVEQHPNSVENDHELQQQQDQQAMLLKQQEELLKKQEQDKQQQQAQEEELLKQQEELRKQQEELRKQQEEQEKDLLIQQQQQAQQEELLKKQQQQEQEDESHKQQEQQQEDLLKQHDEEDLLEQQEEEQKAEIDSVGEDSAPAETLEQARQRLAVYGQYDEGYTVKQVSAINQQAGQSVLFIWAKLVHLTAAFKDIIEPEVAALEADLEEDCQGLLHLREKSETHPVAIVNGIGIKMSTILKYVPKCKVATLIVLNNKEFWSDIMMDADRLATDIRGDLNVTPYQSEYFEVLERFFELYKRLDGDIPLSPPREGGDPNMLAYPLPNSVAADPQSIRRWAETWEVFDFVIPEGGAWGWHGFENLVFPDLKESVDFPQVLRPSDEEIPELDTEVEGEAAWDVIKVDLLKNDVTTEKQNLIWEEREKRSDLDNPERMEKRREKLAKYFIITYEWESSALDAFHGWANSLQAGWQDFQKLCDS